MDREKKREEMVATTNKRKEEEEANAMELDKEKDVNTINANDNLKTEDTGANADDISEKGTMRKKARKERKKDRREKRAREQDENTDETPVHSPPSGLRRATSRFALPRSALNFDKVQPQILTRARDGVGHIKTGREVQRTDDEMQDVDGAAAEGRRHRSN